VATRATSGVSAVVALTLFALVFSACEWSTRPSLVPAAPVSQPAPAPGVPERARRAPNVPPPPLARPASEPSDIAAFAARCAGRGARQRFRGAASYYSDALAGRPTASGERYDPELPTVAHRSLPFGSVLRVVREDTRSEVCVRVNDRGPFVRGRVLDVSRAAAEALGMLRLGVAKVRVEVIELGPPSKAKRRAPPKKKKRRRP